MAIVFARQLRMHIKFYQLLAILVRLPNYNQKLLKIIQLTNKLTISSCLITVYNNLVVKITGHYNIKHNSAIKGIIN